MFGIFKNLFKKPEPAPVATPTSKPVPVVAKPVTPQPAAPSQPVASAPVPAPAPAPAAATITAGDAIHISINALLPRLPERLKNKVANPAGKINIPKAQAAQQLAKGSVKFSFGDLRRMATPGALLQAGDLDQMEVDLPLSEIIPYLSPQSFQKRTDQKTIEIPEDVGGLFDAKGKPLTSKQSAASAAPVKPAALVAPAPAPAPKPAPAAPTPPSKPVAPAPVAAPKPSPPAAPPTPVVPIAPTAPATTPAGPLKVSSDLLSQMAAAAGTKAPPPAASSPVAAAPSAPSAPAGPAGMVAIPAMGLSANWPENIKEDLKRLNLGSAIFLVPVNEMERTLKTGKAAFTWKQLLEWTNPKLTTSHGDVVLELPLKIVAPLFLAAKKPVVAQKKVQVDPSIPDMFTGRGAPVAPPAPAAAPAPAPAAPVTAPAPALTVQPITTPAEAVQRAMQLAGVAGVVIASEDGFSVAAQLPPQLKAEHVAAFMPQIFNRLGQAVNDLGAGSVEHFGFGGAGVNWSVSKWGKMYLIAVSQPQRALPLAEIGALGKDLAKL